VSQGAILQRAEVQLKKKIWIWALRNFFLGNYRKGDKGRNCMILFPVSEEKNRWLKERMEALGINEKDIEEKFVRSSGRGGQKVNKTSSCVYLKHIPTGIEVKCMKGRSQSLNRFLARRELVKRIEKLSGQLTLNDMQMIKIKRQKAKREKRARSKYEDVELKWKEKN
jgi:protein subunit release factor B